MKKLIIRAAAVMFCVMAVASCAKYEDFSSVKDGYADSPEESGDGQGSQAGVLTAGEWNDLANWEFWGKIKERKDIAAALDRWGFNTERRIAVKVKDAQGKPIGGSVVEATMDGKTVWTSVTDNHGTANCWINMFDGDVPVDAAALRIKIDGKEQDGTPIISYPQDGDARFNEYVSVSSAIGNSIDIAFIVDATGSMEDEIKFLKDDLEDIIGKTSGSGMSIRTGAVFYRDTDDEYLTRVSAFTSDLSKTRKFIKEQDADGGGDYPEAVDAALEASLQQLDWNFRAKSRIAFMILDAPAHDQTKVKESIHKSIEAFSAHGIILIPVAASGADISTEIMLRSFAIATNGTYTFLTNDSGVGHDHLEPSVGEYEVENLNDLITRLIAYYME